MEQLKQAIQSLINNRKHDPIIIQIISDESILSPFSTESHLLAYFISVGDITFEDYIRLYNEYSDRNADEYAQRNRYIDLFNMAPRTFGQTWGEEYIRSLFPQFLKATKYNMAGRYPNFDGEFDLWIDGIRVEVKACRANSTNTGGSLASRAYTHNEARAAGFKYHYQQLKPSCCDVFIWIGTCRDELLYWVLTSEELRATGKLGSQHRNRDTGIEGAEVFEGQTFMTEEELRPYRVEEREILNEVLRKGKINQ